MFSLSGGVWREMDVRVYSWDGRSWRLIGRADVDPGSGPVVEVPLFGAASVMVERYTLGPVIHAPDNGGTPVSETAVLLGSGQIPELLPGWVPLAS